MGFQLLIDTENRRKKTKSWAIVSGVHERRHDEPVHFSKKGFSCWACYEDREDSPAFVWTDDAELYNRHTARCNAMFVAQEIVE